MINSDYLDSEKENILCKPTDLGRDIIRLIHSAGGSLCFLLETFDISYVGIFKS